MCVSVTDITLIFTQLCTLEAVSGAKSLEVRCKQMTSTPKKKLPHHEMDSPGKSPTFQPYLTPREAYEMGMKLPKDVWNGKCLF